MKIRYTLLLLILSTLLILSFSSNPPNGRTGAPGDNGTCQSCHGVPGSTTLNGDMVISGLPNTVMAGTTYTVTVNVNNPAMNASRAGFQMVAIDETNSNIGTLSNPGGSSTLTNSGGRVYHEHQPSVSYNGAATVSWTADWTAPSPGTLMDGDSIFFYGSSIIGNGSGSGGDLTRLDQLRVDIVNPNTPLAIEVINLVDPLCNGDLNGQATISIANGQPSYTIAWDNGESTSTATMLSGGNHTVTVTDSNNDTAETSFTLNEPTEVTIANVTTQDLSCFQICDGTISLAVNGGTNNFTFQWTGPDGFSSSLQNQNNLCAGDYTLNVTDTNGCTNSVSVTVEQPEEIIFNDPIIIPVSCAGGSDGSIILNPSGGTGPLNIQWNNGQSGNLTNVIAGAYTATIVDQNNCSTSNSYIVPDAIPSTLEITETTSIPCFGLFGSLQVSSDASNPVYLWSNNVVGALNEGIPAGIYQVTVTSSNGCTAVAEYELNQPSEITLSFDVTNIDQGDDGAIEVIPSGGTGDFSYLWNTNEMNALIVGLDVGNYTVTVTDENGCTNSGSVELQSDCQLEIDTAIISQPLCFDSNDGFIEIVLTNTAGDIDVEWSNGDSLLKIENLNQGVYSVTITEDGVCMIDSTFEVGAPDPITVNYDITQPTSEISNDGMITAIVSGGTPAAGGYNYEWSNQSEEMTIENLAIGTYLLIVTDSLGCQKVDTIVLTEFLCNYTLDVTTSDGVCLSEDDGSATVTINGTGNVDIIFSNGETNLTTENLAAGDYFVAGIDDENCRDTVFFEILNVGDSINFDIISVQDVLCDTILGSIEISVDDDVSISWSNGDIGVLADSLEVSIYSATLTTANGCSRIVEFEIVEGTSDVNIVAQDIEIFLDENGMWNDTSALDSAIVSLEPGCLESIHILYSDFDLSDCSQIGLDTVTASIFSGDLLIDSFMFVATLLDTTPPTLAFTDTIVESTSIFCGSAVINTNFIFDENFATDNCSFIPPVTVSYILDIDTSGTYTYEHVVVDECGNASTVTIYHPIVVFPPPATTATVTDASCFGASDGCIDLVIESGTPPFIISPTEICDVVAGNYVITVEDSAGCINELEVTINQPEEITIVIDDKTDETTGESDGVILVTVEGGNPPYDFSWQENDIEVSDQEDLINFPASQYELIVTDASGCTQTLSTFIDILFSTGNEAFAQIQTYPNPFNDFINIEDPSNMISEIKITNLLGQELNHNTLQNSGQKSIETADLLPGIYLLNIVINDKVYTQKLIKQ